MARRELTFQKHIIDSYAAHRGFAKKWSSGWEAGGMDLIAAHPSVRGHLVEVKHLPTWAERTVRDPRTALQKKLAEQFIAGGAAVFLAVVFGSEKAVGSTLGYWHGAVSKLDPGHMLGRVPYVPGSTKYDMNHLFQQVARNLSWPT